MRDTDRERTGTDPVLDIRRLSGSLGAELRGMDLADPSPDDIDTILDLLAEHQVLLFPDQHLTTDEHLAFGRCFGTLEGHPHHTETSEVREIFELRSSGGGIADEWHSDLTCMPEPSVMSIVQMVTCPDAGGDTMWSSQYAAYEQLSPPMREFCDGLSALHDAHPHDRTGQMAIHPVVRVHPVTGRRSLFVNEHFTRRIVEQATTRATCCSVTSPAGRRARSSTFATTGPRARWRCGTTGVRSIVCSTTSTTSGCCAA